MQFRFGNQRASSASAGLALNHRRHWLPLWMGWWGPLVLLLAMADGWIAQGATGTANAAEGKRCAFIGFTNLTGFSTRASGSNETSYTSPEIAAPIDWDELIVSWNTAPGVHLKAEARAIYPGHSTRYYTMGLWSEDPAQFPRESVRRQRDEDGVVRMDTLVLSNVARKVQVRITAGGGEVKEMVKFVGLSFCNSAVPAEVLPPNRAVWGKVLEVPERRQGEYEGGGGWCSPTSLSMVLAYWSGQLHRPELDHTVPETAHAIADGARGDTGNWPFNTAYAGEYPGMRAYVTRLEDVSELEDWIGAGIPVILSVSSYLASSRTNGPDNGHLITCVGFTDKGDVVVNDPGVSVKRNVRARRVFPRENVVKAWKKSKDAVYLIYPETAKVPVSPLGHWYN